MTAAHERPEFRHAAEWTVSIRFVVAGGSRVRTAESRAERIAARIVSAAARMAGVVEAHAVAGPARAAEGYEPLVARRVRFDAANTGYVTHGRAELRDRYLDPDRERALASLAEANAVYRARQRADDERRRAIGCPNWSLLSRRFCECVYCAPATFLMGLRTPDSVAAAFTINRPRCVCGTDPAYEFERRCPRHRSVRIVPLEGDPPAVAEAARLDPLTAGAPEGGAR